MLIDNTKFWIEINNKINFANTFKLFDNEFWKKFVNKFLNNFIFRKSNIEIKWKNQNLLFEKDLWVIQLNFPEESENIFLHFFLNEFWNKKNNKFIFDYNYFRKMEIWEKFQQFCEENISNLFEVEIFFYNQIIYLLIKHFINTNQFELSNVKEKFEQINFFNIFWDYFDLKSVSNLLSTNLTWYVRFDLKLIDNLLAEKKFYKNHWYFNYFIWKHRIIDTVKLSYFWNEKEFKKYFLENKKLNNKEINKNENQNLLKLYYMAKRFKKFDLN